jgi:hypothetical protein
MNPSHFAIPQATTTKDESNGWAAIRQQKTRAILTEQQAVHIFMSGRMLAKRLAGQYGVSVKAIRDIWNRRTWARETKHLGELGGQREGSRLKLTATFPPKMNTKQSKTATSNCQAVVDEEHTKVSREERNIGDWIDNELFRWTQHEKSQLSAK